MTLVNDADYFYSILKSYGRNNEHIRFARGLNEMQEAIAALRETISRLERKNGLLVDLVEEIRNGDPFVEFMPAYRKTIDDGALK